MTRSAEDAALLCARCSARSRCCSTVCELCGCRQPGARQHAITVLSPDQYRSPSSVMWQPPSDAQRVLRELGRSRRASLSLVFDDLMRRNGQLTAAEAYAVHCLHRGRAVALGAAVRRACWRKRSTRQTTSTRCLTGAPHVRNGSTGCGLRRAVDADSADAPCPVMRWTRAWTPWRASRARALPGACALSCRRLFLRRLPVGVHCWPERGPTRRLLRAEWRSRVTEWHRCVRRWRRCSRVDHRSSRFRTEAAFQGSTMSSCSDLRDPILR